MKNLYLLFSFLLITNSAALAAEINLTTDKKEISTDDVIEVSLSVDGEVDSGKIGIKGLEDFEIIGNSSSSKVQIINGVVTSIQEKILLISPHKEGEFILMALAREDGKEIKSLPVKIKVKKSLSKLTKDKLLESSSENVDEIENINSLKEALKTEVNNEDISIKSLDTLDIPQLNSFPEIQHISAFNSKFWLELIGIFSGIILLGGLMKMFFK